MQKLFVYCTPIYKNKIAYCTPICKKTVKESISSIREDGKRRVQLWIDEDVYSKFISTIIDKYGVAYYHMSQTTAELWKQFVMKHGEGGTHNNFGLSDRELRKLENCIKELHANDVKELTQSALFKLFEQTTSARDKRTYQGYRRLLRSAGLLMAPDAGDITAPHWQYPSLICYPVDATKVLEYIQRIERENVAKNHQKERYLGKTIELSQVEQDVTL